MAGIDIVSGVINYGGVPSAGAGLLANRPAAGVTGRLFIGTDTNILYRDTGSTWVTIGGAGGITGSGAAGQATFWTGASAISGDNAFFWDNTNKRLGLGTVTPGVRLDIHGTGVIQQLNGTTTNSAFLDFQNAGTTQWRIGNNYNAALNDFLLLNNNTANNSIVVKRTNNYMLFNSPDTTTIAYNYEFFNFNNASGNFLALYDYTNSATVNGFIIRKTRATTKGSFSATLNNDTLLNLSCQGSSASAFVGAAYVEVLQQGTVSTFTPCQWNFFVNNGTAYNQKLNLSSTGFSAFSDRLNINGATDNALFELNNNGNFYTGGLSPTILTVSGNTTMARTATGYYCTATLTLTLPSAASLNNVYWVIAGSGVTVTVNRAGTDDILNLAGASVTSITITSNQRAMFYVGGGTRTFLISQA